MFGSFIGTLLLTIIDVFSDNLDIYHHNLIIYPDLVDTPCYLSWQPYDMTITIYYRSQDNH